MLWAAYCVFCEFKSVRELSLIHIFYMTGTIEQLQIDAPVRIEIDTQGDNFLAYGESMEITCKVFKGWEDITDLSLIHI